MANKFTPKAQLALNRAMESAMELGHTYIGSEHLLLGLISTAECASSRILTERGLCERKIRETVIEITGIGSPTPVSPSDMTPRVKKIIEQSGGESSARGHAYVGTEHLLLSLASDRDCVAVRIIESLGVTQKDLLTDVERYMDKSPVKRDVAPKERSESDARSRGKEALSAYGKDLCAMARDGKIDPVIGRERETERVIQILSRRSKNNPCLIGEPGVGKTAVVEGLAQRISDGDVPEILRGKRVISLDVGSMIAGAKYRGEFEERLKSIIAESKRDPDIIIFIDEIHTIIGAGAAEGAIDAANMIKPELSRGELRVIGATTLNEYRKYIEKDAALERRFQSVSVGEPSVCESVRILKGLRSKYEAHHKLTLSDEAIEAAVELSARYISDRYLPDKAIDLLDEAAARLRLRLFTAPPEYKEIEKELSRLECEKAEAVTEQNFEAAAALRDRERELREKYEHEKGEWEKRKLNAAPTLRENDVAEVVTLWTGVPVSRLMETEAERLSTLSERLKERVIGQDGAVDAVSGAVRRGRTGLKDPKRPIGSFIFAGSTGVGKTELCRALSEALFGSEEAMIRLDMSEYMEKHSISKLIGSPPGYVGYDEGGYLTERVRRKPYSIVLFDEIEKAHRDVCDLLLQILEDGILTDSQGRRVDFRNTLIILTTNVGSPTGRETGKLGFAASDTREDDERKRIESELYREFKPELINRVDEIIIFKRLDTEALERIAALLLARVEERIEERGVFIDFDKSVYTLISDYASGLAGGARGLRRAITRLVEDPYSEAIIRGEFKKGDLVKASASDGRILFQKAAK